MKTLPALPAGLLAPVALTCVADGGGGAASTRVASGAFDVQLTPQPPAADADADTPPRMSLRKAFHGALEATSVGEMIAYRSPVAGSAGYVAMEVVRGTLDGHAGSFVLQHSATMTRGVPEQSVLVVPDSATGALAGLAGRMTIAIAADGAHSYRFEYTLPDAAR